MAIRTPEGMSGGWRTGRFVVIGGVLCAAVAYGFLSSGREPAAQVYGEVPRITGTNEATGYTEDRITKRTETERQKPRQDDDRGVNRRNEGRSEFVSSGSRGSSNKDDFMQRGLKAGLGGFKAEEDIVKAAWSKNEQKSDFQKSGSKCWLPPGAFIPARSVTRIVTEKPGIVKAKITVDIWDTSGTCLIFPADTDIVADYAATETRGEKRVPITNLEIVRPFPADDTVTISGVAGDSHGAAGVPGETSSNLLSTALLVTASVGIDLAMAALTDGGSLIGPIIGNNASRPLDQIANDMWNRPSINQVDEKSDILIILRKGVKGDDFRDH
jgi:type IV secretory pathway VirB10-like protein